MAPIAKLPEPIADSVETAAYRLGICRAQFYREVRAGRLKVRKLGRRTLVPRAEQARWLEALPVHQTAFTATDPHDGQGRNADINESGDV